jgi:hypothetical protein
VTRNQGKTQLCMPSIGVSVRVPGVPAGHHNPVRCARPGHAGVYQFRAPALAGFLAGYSGLTRQAYKLDLG